MLLVDRMGRKFVPGMSHRGAGKMQRVTILGMARQGLAVARYFFDRGAHVTVSDLRPAESLAGSCAELQEYAVAHGQSAEALCFALGGHPMSLLDTTDLLCLSGGVSPAIDIVQEAVARGIPLTNDSLLTLQHCPVPIMAITGSAGKTTTTTLVGEILAAAGYTVHVGGNIGTPLIDRLGQIQAGDKVVMELSSFQLELYDRSPAVAAILNITPNHLDRHPSMSHYAAAKANILRFQEPGNTAVLNADDAYTGPWLADVRCTIPAGAGQSAVYFPLRSELLAFSLNQEVKKGGCLIGDRLIYRSPGQPDAEICRAGDVRLRGRHNLANILAAACLAGAAGAEPKAMTAVATTFAGVAHRLEIVRERDGVLWVNDSIATTPERTIAALRSFKEPVVLLLGGRDKHLPWAECVALAYERARHVLLFGEAADLIGDALAEHGRQTGMALPTTHCRDLAHAVAQVDRLAQAGDVVLLAPGGTSFDAYVDFAARGQHFRELVESLP
jgi:UDP-N-acetylmuramoylalanine--D-glutamate ligase